MRRTTRYKYILKVKYNIMVYITDDFEFWDWVSNEPKVMRMFNELEKAFKRFEGSLMSLGYNYIYLDVFPFDQRRITVVFGEYEPLHVDELKGKEEERVMKERENYFSITFDNITPSPIEQPTSLSYEVYAMWWLHHAVPEESDFVNLEGIVEKGLFHCVNGDKREGKSQAKYLWDLGECYNNLIKAVNKRDFKFPLM
ncbi:hypothetical protein [Saccharolobus sp.]|uniref:hypothetical protein n=2 Tax=Sulfolobaceae TaxID=118883 RepID=UPI00317762F3